MDEATLRARTQELLRRMGPLTAREIAARLSGGADAAAVPPPRELHRLLLDDPDPELDPSDPGAFHPFPLADGRLVDLDDLVDGTVFTHVLTDDERAAGEVVATPDLAPLLLCSHDSLELPLHGHDTPARYLRDGRLAGPDGWLPDAPVLVARLRDGAVELAGADAAPEPDPTLAEHLAAVWDVLADRPYPADDVELVVEALARHPHMFDAAPCAPGRPAGRRRDRRRRRAAGAAGRGRAADRRPRPDGDGGRPARPPRPRPRARRRRRGRRLRCPRPPRRPRRPVAERLTGDEPS